MSTSSQEPRGSGLSSSLVSDFRAIMNSLEQEKAARQQDEPVGAAVPAAASAAPSLAARVASPPLAERVVSSRPAPTRPAAEATAPRSFNDVRERLTALGDVSDMLARRAPAAGAPASKPEAAGAVAGASEPRRRGFGASPRQPGEAEQRRKRGAPKDVITWQRLGVLAVFMALVGGGGVALQSLAAREEAKVAPEVIGNAAVASVAPSAPAAPAPVALAAAPAAPPAPEPESAAPPESAASPAPASIAESLPPVLRDTTPPFDVAATPPGVTAFAPPDDAAATEVEPAVAEAVAAAAAVELPKDVPLPPRAPARRTAAAAAAAEAPEAAAEDVADEADSPAGFGGDPVGSATIRRTVTMRAAPKRGATPIGNLSAGEKVQLVACHGWCEVIAEGKRGFIYKSFVDAGTSARADTAADSETAAQ